METTAARLNVAEIAEFRRKLRDNNVIEHSDCRNKLVQAFGEAGIRNFEPLLISDLDAVCRKIGIAAPVKIRLFLAKIVLGVGANGPNSGALMISDH